MTRLRMIYMLGLAFGLVACDTGNPDDTGGIEPGVCEALETRCEGNVLQVCEEGAFREMETCAAICDGALGCIDCRPGFPQTCVGDEVHACNADGSIGELLDSCPADSCVNGSCGASDCRAGAELIYVIDNTYRLLSFDPRKLGTAEDPFALVGTVDCPAGPAWPAWDGGRTPFSMSVDRNAVAWVLYTSGEIFHVSTQDASCQETGFAPGQEDFQLFGMGFVSDAPGSPEETLWVAGGLINRFTIGDLGYIDPDTLTLTEVGALPNDPAHSPELTGTGDAQLFGYYPGDDFSRAQVGLIDKGTGDHEMTWRFNPPPGDTRAWAFAHWGGDYYIFITTEEFGDEDSQVLRFDTETGDVSEELSGLPYVIVGAGVSTCAPVVIE